MIAILYSLIVSIAQLYAINRFIKPNSAYASVIHLFLIYPVVMLQIFPLTLELLLVENNPYEYQFAQLFAYTANAIYFYGFLIIWRKVSTSLQIPTFQYTNKHLITIVIISSIFNIVSLINYLKLIEFELEEAIFPFYAFLQSFSKVAPFLVLMFLSKENKLAQKAGIAGVIIYFISIIPTGHRGSLVIPTIFLIFYYPKFNFKKKLIIAIALLIAFIPIADYYKSLRIITNPSEAINSQEHYSRNFVEELNYRLGENNKISTGVAKMIIERGPVGYQPLISSFSAFIPSYYLDGPKPWPGSVDGTEFGILARKAHEYVYGEGWNMSEYFYTLHPIWELGYLYFFINIIISAVWLLSLERVSRFIGDKFYILAICSFLPFTYGMVIPPLTFILQTLAYITIPGILFIFILNKFHRISIFFTSFLSTKYKSDCKVISN